MKLKLETLSPVHIGSGAEISPSEYYFDAPRGEVCRLNFASLIQDPAFSPHLEKYVSETARGQRQIDRLVPTKVLAHHVQYRLLAQGEARAHLAGHPTVIKAQVQSGGRSFIPGSSLKGSLLSALMWHILKNRATEDNSLQASIARAMAEPNPREALPQYNHLLGVCLGRFCGLDPDRFAKWLAVSDTNLLPPQGRLAVVLVQVVGARRGGQIPVLQESLRPGIEFFFDVSLPAGACRNREREKLDDPEEVLSVADAFYRRVWGKTETDPPPTGGWLLRLGQGSGAWATSLLLLAEDLKLADRYKVKPPITRKLADGRDSLGWVLLSLAGEDIPEWVTEPDDPQALPPTAPDLSTAPVTPPATPTAAAPTPSSKLQELLTRLKGTKPHDAGQIAMFIDGLKALTAPEEQRTLAQAILTHFNRKKLQPHKRWNELEPFLK